MEVEARMKRNYLPPSMGGYQNPYQGYQSPPPTGPSTQNQPNQGISNFGAQNQKIKPTLETIPQGSIMCAMGSITSGTPITQTSTYSPSISNYCSVQSSVPNAVPGSISSGTPITTPASFMSGTTMNSSFDGNTNFGTSFGSPSGSTFENFSTTGSITSGTPMSTGYGYSNQRSITSGTPVANFDNHNFNFGNFGNFDSSFGSPNTNFGSITGGTPMNQAVPSGSITAGTPVPNNYANTNYNTRQRKYSGPQRVKLQMLATVQEMGNFCFVYYYFGIWFI